MYNNFFFLFYVYHTFFFFHLVAPKGGCPSPRACGAYPKRPGYSYNTFVMLNKSEKWENKKYGLQKSLATSFKLTNELEKYT